MSSQNRSSRLTLPFLSVVFALVIVGAVVTMLVVPRQDAAWPLLAATAIVAALCLMLVAMLASRRAVTAIVRQAEQQAAPVVEAAPPPPPRPAAQGNVPAMMLLTLLQEKGRFLDFVMEDITAYSDEQVSAAARVVHQGCREVIRDSFDPAPISETAQNATVTLPEDYPAHAYRLVGNLGDGKPPTSGTIRHKGWQARRVKLPQPAREPREQEARIIVPAEVEV